MDKSSVELEPIYVRISTTDDSNDEQLAYEPINPIAPEAPKRKWRRCAFGLLALFTVLWVTALVVSGYFVAASVRQCVHGVHHRHTTLSYSPEELTGLDLFAVAGTITVHSCPYAKNITVKISEGAASESLLEAMKTQHALKAGVLHLFSMGPSFDWHHCQTSHIEVVLPASSHLNLTAQAVAGLITVNTKSTFDRVALGTSFGMIKSHNLHVLETLHVRAMVGVVSLHDVISNVTHVEVGTGVAQVNELLGMETRVDVRAGVARLNSIESNHTLSIAVEIGAVCAKEIGPSTTTRASVDYGLIGLKPTRDSCYAFLMETIYGQLSVAEHHHHSKNSNSTISSNTKKSGVVGKEVPHSNIFVSTQYGHVTLYTDHPVAWDLEN
jgi:hypothetical protein